MAKSISQTLKLKDPATTFFDPETRLKVAGDHEVSIDKNQKKGKLTLAAIQAGGLIEVGTKAADKDEAANPGK